MNIVDGCLDNPDVVKLIEFHLRTSRAMSPEGSSHALDLSGLRASTVQLFAAWEGSVLLGVGALKTLCAQTGEVKCMHTVGAARRKGVARAILKHIIEQAKGLGMNALLLETGSSPAFFPARELYVTEGFKEVEPFGNYHASSNNIFYRLEWN